MHILVLDYIDGLIKQEYNVRHIGSGYSQGNSFKEKSDIREKYEYRRFQSLCIKASVSWRF